VQVGLQLLDLAAWTVGEHADRAHIDHDLAGWADDVANLDPTPARLMSTPSPAGLTAGYMQNYGWAL
jgi:hypothetical protein